MLDRDSYQVWHEWFNKQENRDHTMYAFKEMLLELSRLPLLFRAQRQGKLPKEHKGCSLSKPVEVKDPNKLTCCLGENVAACPILKGLEDYVSSRKFYNLTPEQMDKLKATTCCWHILKETNMGRDGFKNGVDTTEGYIQTEESKMYWGRVYENLSGGAVEDER